MKINKKLQLGSLEVTTGMDTIARMALFIWGAATCGKSTFAATAPGDKLWLSLGDQEHAAIMHRKDVHVVNLSALTTEELFKHAQSDNPFGLDSFLQENENFETVVMDSATALTYRALQQSVAKGIGSGRGFVPTIEAPGQSAYGGRNAIVLAVLTGILRVTAKHGVHVIITAHEGDPINRIENGKELIDYYTIMLGGQLVNNMTWRLSEIWYMSQAPHGDRERKIAVRPTRLRKPMKTRMFSGKDEPEFILNYDADLPDDTKGQMTIAKWYNAWRDSGCKKLRVPSRVIHTKEKKK